MAKQRPDKYEKKVAIDASFEDAMKAFSTPVNTVKLDGDFKYYAALVKGTVTLDKVNPRFPTGLDDLFSKEFSVLEVSTEGKGVLKLTYRLAGGIPITETISPNPMTKKGVKSLRLNSPFYAFFQIDLTDITNSLKVDFKFS